MNRRHFLRAATGSLVLPWLDAFAVGSKPKPKQRMVCLCAPLGLHPAFFFPEKACKDYVASPYLERLKAHRDQLTVFSGVSCPLARSMGGDISLESAPTMGAR